MHRGKVWEMWELDELVRNREEILKMSIMCNAIKTGRYFVDRRGVVCGNKGGLIGSLTVNEYRDLLKENSRGPDFTDKYIGRIFFGYKTS